MVPEHFSGIFAHTFPMYYVAEKKNEAAKLCEEFMIKWISRAGMHCAEISFLLAVAVAVAVFVCLAVAVPLAVAMAVSMSWRLWAAAMAKAAMLV